MAEKHARAYHFPPKRILEGWKGEHFPKSASLSDHGKHEMRVHQGLNDVFWILTTALR